MQLNCYRILRIYWIIENLRNIAKKRKYDVDQENDNILLLVVAGRSSKAGLSFTSAFSLVTDQSVC